MTKEIHLNGCTKVDMHAASATKRLRVVIQTGEPVWPSGKAGKQRGLGSNPFRLSFLFKKCGL